GHGLGLGEAALGVEDALPELEEVALLSLLLRRRLDVRGLVDRIPLAALDRIREDLGGLLYALEEGVVLVAAGCGFLVGVVAQHLLAVGTLDLLLRSLVAVFGQAQHGVVILVLEEKSGCQTVHTECFRSDYGD